MSDFGNLDPHDRMKLDDFRAELDMPDHSVVVVERVGLVAVSLAAVSGEIVEAMRSEYRDPGTCAAYVGQLRNMIDVAAENLENSQIALARDPIRAGMGGVRFLMSLLKDYTSHAAKIFEGYEPVSLQPGWSRGFPDRSLRGFGNLGEKLILRVSRPGPSGEPPHVFTTYEELRKDSLARGLARVSWD